MSTRANISVAIATDDIGTTKQFNATQQAFIGFCVGSDLDAEYPIRYKKIIDFKKRPKIKLQEPYLSVYSHWDGYPGHLGKVLLERYDEYDIALNLLLGGDIEGVNYQYVSYGFDSGVNDSFNIYSPDECDAPLEEHEFSYLFKDGEWYVKGHSIMEYTLLKKIVADIILGKRDVFGYPRKR